MAEAEHTPSDAGAASPDRGGGAPATRSELRILLVEDEPLDAQLVTALLSASEGGRLELTWVQRLVDADAHLSTSDCVLLDLSLPDASGLDGLVHLHGLSPRTPIVVVSATDDEALALSALGSGAQDYLVKTDLPETRLARVIRYAVKRKRAELDLEDQALRDHLTGLANRRLLDDRLLHALDRLRRSDETVALFFIDLDDFKRVNDSLGHEAGDTLLRAVGQRLSQVLRATDTVARLGGDEFVVLCETIEPAEAPTIAARLTGAVSDSGGDGVDVTGAVTASVGAVVATGGPSEPAELLRLADAALYRAKAVGGNHVEVVTIDLRDNAQPETPTTKRGVACGG